MLLAALPTNAAVKPNPLFSDGAVLQQGCEVPVWGTASPGENITVKLLDQTVTTVARDGRWMVRLKPLEAGGPYTMTIIGQNTVTIQGLLVGEVWLCSGQSNMAFQLARAENAREAIDNAADTQLRFFKVPHEAADVPKTEALANWIESTPQTASSFSAVAYYFGRELRRNRGVAVGLIDSSVGGTPAEAWTSHATLSSDPRLAPILERQAEAVRAFKAKPATGSGAAKKTNSPTADPSRTVRRPSGLYNAMIAPLEPYAIAGVIWYQGEGNASRAAEYRVLFPAMIRNWRQAWGQGDFPFLFVQIAPHERMTPEIREAQWFAWKETPRTAMAVTTDVGDVKDIHPKDKQTVGVRLALAARALAYGESIEYSGPVFERVTFQERRAILSFRHAAGGLVAKGGKLRGFEIADDGGQYVAAEAIFEGETVIVSSEAVSRPAAVRYGWAQAPDVNLFNRAGLPASPFRTKTLETKP